MCMIGDVKQGLKIPKARPKIAWRVFKTLWYADDLHRLGAAYRHFPYKRSNVHLNKVMPTTINTSGFWSFKKRDDALRECDDNMPILAKVAMSGVVVEHMQGWRASRMCILSLESPRRKHMDQVLPEMLRSLRNGYLPRPKKRKRA